MFRLESENPDDDWEVEVLLDTAFGTGRFGLTSYRFREGVDPVAGLSVVARDEAGVLVGCIRFWPIRINATAALLLGPVAVHPTRQGEGIGGAIVHEGLSRATAKGWSLVFLIGDLPYYQRFGFQRVSGVEFPLHTDPKRILALTLSADVTLPTLGVARKWDGHS